MKKKTFITAIMIGFSAVRCLAADFVLAEHKQSVPILVDGNDWKGVQRAANNLKEDIFRVSGCRSLLESDTSRPHFFKQKTAYEITV